MEGDARQARRPRLPAAAGGGQSSGRDAAVRVEGVCPLGGSAGSAQQ